jgi:hypothetical protein
MIVPPLSPFAFPSPAVPTPNSTCFTFLIHRVLIFLQNHPYPAILLYHRTYLLLTVQNNGVSLLYNEFHYTLDAQYWTVS